GLVEPRRLTGRAERPDQVVVGEAADVVEVERVGRRFALLDVFAGPSRPFAEVEGGFGAGKPRGQLARRGVEQRERELARAELEVVAPLLLGIEAERDRGQELPL